MFENLPQRFKFFTSFKFHLTFSFLHSISISQCCLKKEEIYYHIYTLLFVSILFIKKIEEDICSTDIDISVKVFKNVPSKIYGRQPLWTDMDCLTRPYHFKFFKGCLSQILIGCKSSWIHWPICAFFQWKSLWKTSCTFSMGNSLLLSTLDVGNKRGISDGWYII